ncbi:MAG: DegT/DnrJ/EryC1/StrS family aminotransferase [Bacteroidales bacterium]|nr:DegT/DnrJ/EryC1/StrS family aminotransferase [Bacteroidales bacterium]MCF8402548.1 DegT/DnrJ/EryC1/StrS family aminotransferase [Bacteroidales bacterium]
MIRYSFPHIYLSDLFKIPFQLKSEKRIIDHFRNYTGKKHILITSSCRSALYLTYLALSDNRSEVITSPLTCTSAVTPIVEAGKRPVFVDINPKTFLIDENRIEPAINKNTLAIQAIHLGGLMCNMHEISERAKINKLYVIEDCAQGYGSSLNNRNCGSFGDVACFSLAKNIFGIGGGILATSNENIYQKAVLIQSKFLLTSLPLSLYRLFRSFLETYPENSLMNKIHQRIKSYRNRSDSVEQRDEKTELYRMLKIPNKLEIKVASYQLQHRTNINLKKRIEIAGKIQNGIRKTLNNTNFTIQCSDAKKSVSYTKFYLYLEGFNSRMNIERINHQFNIEAKHLEHKSNSFFQEDFSKIPMLSGYLAPHSLNEYYKVHKDILTLPVHEKMDESNIKTIVKCFIGY